VNRGYGEDGPTQIKWERGQRGRDRFARGKGPRNEEIGTRQWGRGRLASETRAWERGRSSSASYTTINNADGWEMGMARIGTRNEGRRDERASRVHGASATNEGRKQPYIEYEGRAVQPFGCTHSNNQQQHSNLQQSAAKDPNQPRIQR
jgi:hypothetical protein